MFLNVTKRRNPKLIETGVSFHQSGKIPPNTYIIDIDNLRENTKKLAETAATYNMQLYYMTKQLGRIPQLAEIIEKSGLEKAVVVDFDEGRKLDSNNMQIGHAGHLVQPGKNQWMEVLNWNPEVVTIFSYERAKQLSDAALKMNVKQDILLKVYGPADDFYDAQEGGIPLGNLSEGIKNIKKLGGVSIVGVTTFPNLQLNEAKTDMIPTNNMFSLIRAKEILQENGIDVKHVNGPSGTSCVTIPYLSQQGITHSEPGHSITGTTPLHAYKNLPEKPAIIYVSEVSHVFEGKYQVIAGGFYSRSRMQGCLVGHNPNNILNHYVTAYQNNPEAIDYYGMIDFPKDFSIEIGDTAIFAFRTQIFVTRAHVALVEGIQSGKPKLIHFERK